MSKTAEEYGIETLKDVADTVLNFFDDLRRAKADDGKVSFIEGIKIGLGSTPGIIEIFVGKRHKQLPKELLDISTTEQAELLRYITATKGYTPQEAKQKLQDIISFIGAGIRLVERL